MQFIKNRAVDIISKPSETWQVIDKEEENESAMLNNYFLPLVILGAVSAFMGLLPRLNLSDALVRALAELAIPLLSVYFTVWLLGYILERMSIEASPITLFKLLIYGQTPGLLAGIVASLHPSLMVFGLFGLYTFYLLWTGIRVMIKPDDNQIFAILSLLILTLFFTKAGVATLIMKLAMQGAQMSM